MYILDNTEYNSTTSFKRRKITNELCNTRTTQRNP